MTVQTVDPPAAPHLDLRRMRPAELDALFRSSAPGPIPAGKARGTAILLPGRLLDAIPRLLIRALWWKGKIFRLASGDLKNRIGPFGMPAIRAKVYADESWFDGGRAIILDYSRTSLVARKVRDEIREIAPGQYLGLVYLWKWRVGYFALAFPPAPDAPAAAAGSRLQRVKSTLRKVVFGVGVLTLVAAIAAGTYLTVRLNDDRPVTYDSDEDHFKYGSTGGERGFGKHFGFGIPYWIWVALPELFPEYLPGAEPGQGYASFGMIYEPGRDPRFDLPVGMSLRRVQGIDRVYFNCAVCHTGSVRAAPGADPQIVLAMPANTFDLGALAHFLGEAAVDWRFRASRIFPKIEELETLRAELAPASTEYRPAPLSRVDRFVFDYVAISMVREQLLTLTSRLSFLDVRSWGPGRVDTFNPPKALLGFPMERASAQEKIGNAALPAVWNQRWKDGMQLHWDGNNTDVNERNLSAAFGTGATPATLDTEKLLRVADWLWDGATPPAFSEAHIDRELAARGAPIYQANCWSCHGNREPPFRIDGDGGLVGTVTPIEEIGTDRARLDSYTPALAAAQNSLYAGFPADEAHCRERPDDRARCYPARFRSFRKTNGYANMPLDGLWLRAPYLHNGSVPDLRALLEPAAARPRLFYAGYDVYDFENVGFVAVGPEAERHGWRFDTSLPGNGNFGHEYGTDLSAEQKRALVEYLKTF